MTHITPHNKPTIPSKPQETRASGLKELPFYDFLQPIEHQSTATRQEPDAVNYHLFIQGQIPIFAKRTSAAFTRAVVQDHIYQGLDRPVMLIPAAKLEGVIALLEGICSYKIINMQTGTGLLELELQLGYDDISNSKTLEAIFAGYQFKAKDFDNADETYTRLYKEATDYYEKAHSTADASSTSILPSLKKALQAIIPALKKKTDEKYFADIRLSPISKSQDLLKAEEHLIKHILKDAPGFCIGECHPLFAPKLFLLEHMSFLASQRVKKIFLEPLVFDTAFDLLMEYNKSAPDAPMPAAILKYLTSIDEGQGMKRDIGYRAVLEAAHRAGIELIPIDTYRARNHSEKTSKYRAINMNYEAIDLIKHHNEKDGKYVIWVGLAHATKPFDSTLKEKLNAGLAISTSTPIIECQDSLSKEGSSSISIKSIEGSALPHIVIKRDVFHQRDGFSAEENKALDLYLTLKSETKTIQECKKELKDSLAALQKAPHANPLLVEFIKARYMQSLSRQNWAYASHQPESDYINRSLAKALCHELSSIAPSLTFSKEYIEGYLTGGSCSALVMMAASHLSTMQTHLAEGFSLKDQINYLLNHKGTEEELLSIQSALNTVSFAKNSAVEHPKKIDSITGLFGFSAEKKGDTIAICADDAFGRFEALYHSLPNEGMYFIRCIDPSNNKKGENHGHSTLLLRQNKQTLFYDPNYGVKVFDCQKGLRSLFSDLILSHLSFRIPLLSVYQIAPNDETKVLLPKALIDHRTSKINASKQDILSLPKAAQHLIMACSEETNTFLSHGFSLEDLKRIPLCLAAIILQNPSLLTSLFDAGYDMTLLESSDLPIETRRKMLKDAKSLREIRLEGMRQKLSFCRFIGHFSSNPALEYQLSKKVALSLTAQGPLQALTAEGEEPLLNPRQNKLLQDLTVVPLSSGTERADHDIGTNAHALRSLALGLHVLDEEAKGPSHLQNIVEDCSNTNIKKLIQKYGESSLDALLKLNQEEGLISNILSMDKVLAEGLIEYAKCKDFAFPSKGCKTPSWRSVIKEEKIDIVMQRAQKPSYFRAIVSLRENEITLEELNTLPPKVLHAILEFNSGILIKLCWKNLTEDLDSTESLCSRLNTKQFSLLIYNIAIKGIKLSKIASLEKIASVALVEASDLLDSVNKDVIILFKHHVVLRWIEGGKAELFRGLIYLLQNDTATLDDIKTFDVQKPGKIHLLLHMATDVAKAVEEYNFNWKDFFYSPTLENKDCKFLSNIEVTLPPLNVLDNRDRKAYLKTKDVFYLHHKGITLKNLLDLQPKLCNGALLSLPSIVEMYKKDPDFSFNDFIRSDRRDLLTSVLSFHEHASAYEKTKLIETTFQNMLHLYSAKITDLSLEKLGQLVFFGSLENAGLIASQIEKKTLDWDKFIRDPHLKSILEGILNTDSITSYNSQSCRSLFAGLIRLASSGLYPSSIYQLSTLHPLIRIKDPILSAEALTFHEADQNDWNALFCDSGAKDLFDRVGYEGAKDLLSLFKDGISLDRLAALRSSDVIKKIIESAEELKTLKETDRHKCIELAEEDGFSRLQDKYREVSFAALVKLRIIGFSLNDLWSTPYLHELAKISDAFYQCKDQAFSMPSQKASRTDRPSPTDTDTESRTQSIIPFEIPELNKDEQATIHKSINILLQIESMLPASPKSVMELLADSDNPIYILKLLTQHPKIIEKTLSLPKIDRKEFLAEEYAELFASDPSFISLLTPKNIRELFNSLLFDCLAKAGATLEECSPITIDQRAPTFPQYTNHWASYFELSKEDLTEDILQIINVNGISRGKYPHEFKEAIRKISQLKNLFSQTQKHVLEKISYTKLSPYQIDIILRFPEALFDPSFTELLASSFTEQVEHLELVTKNTKLTQALQSNYKLNEIFKEKIRKIFQNLDKAIHFYKRPDDAYEEKEPCISAYISHWSNLLEINRDLLLKELLEITQTDDVKNLESSSILVKISKRHTQLLSNLFQILPIIQSSKQQEVLIQTLSRYDSSLYSREFIKLIDEKGLTNNLHQLRELRLFSILSSHQEIPSLMIESNTECYFLFTLLDIIQKIDEFFCKQTNKNSKFREQGGPSCSDILDIWAGYTDNNKEQFYNAFIKAITSPHNGGGTEEFLALLDEEYTPLIEPLLNNAATYLYFLESFLKSNVDGKNQIIKNLKYITENIAIPYDITKFQDLLSIPIKILKDPINLHDFLTNKSNLFPILLDLCQQDPSLSSEFIKLVNNLQTNFLDEIRQNQSRFKRALESGKITIAQIYETAKASDYGSVKELMDTLEDE